MDGSARSTRDLSSYGFRPVEADRIDWRAATSRREIDGATMSYVELGDPAAPPLVLIHGLSGSWLNWKLVMPPLARRHRVIAIDLPGFGDSPPIDQPVTMSGYARLVAGLCKSLGLGPVNIAANSMGGYVAVELAAEHQSRVNSLVLSSAAGITTASINTERMIRNAKQLANASRMVPAPLRRRLMQRAEWRKRVLIQFVEHGDLLDPLTANELAQGAGSPGYAAAVRALAERNVKVQAERVKCPTLIVWGDQDRIIPVRHAERFAALIEGSAVEIFRDAGHMQMVEYPEAFAEIVSRFVSEHAQ